MTTSSRTTQTPAWRRDDLLHEWDFFRRQGYTLPQAARRIGVSQGALEQAITRARRDGDPRAIRKAAA